MTRPPEASQAWLDYVQWLRRWRLAIFALATMIGVLGVLGMQRLAFDPDVLVYFDRTMPERQALEAVEDRFGRTNEIVFVLRTPPGEILGPRGLEALRYLHGKARELPGAINVRSVLSLVEAAGNPAETAAQAPLPDAAQLREAARAAGRAGRGVLSADESVAAVAAIVPRNSRQDIDVTAFASEARQLQAEFRQRYPSVELLLTGRLMMDSAFITEGQDDTYFFAAVQIGVLALVLLITFRSVVATTLLMTMQFIATLGMIGVVGWIGYPLNGISSAAPSVLIGLALAIAIHIVLAWQSARRWGLDGQAAVAAALTANAVPVTLSVLTTLVSFLCLNFAASPPFRQLGNVVSLGLVLTFAASFTLLPALLLSVPGRIGQNALQMGAAMAALARFVCRRQRALLAAFVATGALSVAGAAQITFDDTFSHYFDERFEIRRATDLFEDKLSGTIFVDFSVPAGDDGAFGRDHLARLQQFSDWLLLRPEVADVLSLASVAEEFAKTAPPQLFDLQGLPAHPQGSKALEQVYGTARESGLIGLTDEARRNSRVNAVLRGVSSADTLAFVKAAEAKASELFGARVTATGLPRLSAQLSLDSSRSMIFSMLLTLAMVSVLLLVALRDVRLGLISLLPNILPIVTAYGLWGLLVGEVSFAATVVGALTFGIIVDDTVHIMVKYRRLRLDEGMSPEQAIAGTFASVGVAVMVTSVALALSFLVFTFSGFLVNQHLGWLTAIVLLAALVADFLFLPPLILLMERWGGEGAMLTEASRRRLVRGEAG